MWFKLSQFILRQRIGILIFLGLMTLFFGYYAFTSLKIDNKYGNMLPKDSPAQSDYLVFQEMFGEDGGTLIFAIQTDSLYTPKNLLKWKELGDRIKELDGINSVFSEVDLVSIHNNKKSEKFELVPIFTNTTFTEKSIEDVRMEIRQYPLFNGLLYNDSTHVSLMLINVDESYLSNVKKSGVVLDAEHIAKEYEDIFGIVHFSGLPHIRVVLGKRVVNEMFLFIGIAVFVTSILLYLFFRSFRVVLFCNMVVFTAVIWAIGSMGLMGFKVSILMALIPPLMIVIGIPNCIYLLNNFHHEFKAHGNKIKALSRIIYKIGYATFLTNLTTALGFSTFIFTNSEKLVEFGISSTINIMFVFILAITIIPIMFSFSSKPQEKHLQHLNKKLSKVFTEKMIYITTTYRTVIYSVLVVVIGLAIVGGTKMKATGNLTSDIPKDDPILRDIEFIQANFGGVIPFEILLNYKVDGKKFDNNLLRNIDALQFELSKDSQLSKSISVVDFMKLINMAYYGNNPEMYQLIKKRDMVRLKNYLANFQEDFEGGKQIHSFQDSIRLGISNYADSILFHYPRIANEVMDYHEIFLDTADSSKTQLFPSSTEVASFLEINRDARKILTVSEQFYPPTAMGISIKQLGDTANTIYRIRMQVNDLSAHDIAQKTEKVATLIEAIFNPNQQQIDSYLENYNSGKMNYADSILNLSNSYINKTAFHIADGNDSLLFEFDMNPELLSDYYGSNEFDEALKKAIDEEKIDYIITGTSVVSAEGTHYLINNLFTSIGIAVIIISLLMGTLFFDFRMVLISLVSNFVPLVVTAGIMGFFHIPIKPSTLLVFSIAFGISVDDTIHFLTKYRQELQVKSYDVRGCILEALQDTGISMLYTTIVLCAGFSMFVFSEFGGTRALGLLISLTLLVAMFTNLFVLPSLLLTMEKRVSKQAFHEPFSTIYNEEIDIELDELEVDPKTGVIFQDESEENN